MHNLKLSGLVLIYVSSAFFLFSCGENSNSGNDNDTTCDADVSSGCDCGDSTTGSEECEPPPDGENPLTDEYVVGLEKVTESGLYTVQLTKSEPLPKYVDKYLWTLALLDIEGKPVSGAKLEAEARMPQHAHGTFPPVSYATEMGAKGTYVLEKMDLFMPGVWEINVRFTVNATNEEVFYRFDLEG